MIIFDFRMSIFDLKKGDEILRSDSTCAVLIGCRRSVMDEQIENRKFRRG